MHIKVSLHVNMINSHFKLFKHDIACDEMILIYDQKIVAKGCKSKTVDCNQCIENSY